MALIKVQLKLESTILKKEKIQEKYAKNIHTLAYDQSLKSYLKQLDVGCL